MAGFQGIVGALDGTHIQIIAPNVNKNEFVNRHHYHSINIQECLMPATKLLM